MQLRDTLSLKNTFPVSSPTIKAERYSSRLNPLKSQYTGDAVNRVYKRSSLEDRILLTQLLEREGCRLSGYIDISKAPGSVSFFINLRQQVLNKYNINATELIKGFTFTHTINFLSFGSTKDQKEIMRSFKESSFMKFDRARDIPEQSNVDYCLYYFALIPYMFFIDKEVYQYSIAYNCQNSSLPTSEFQLALSYSTSHIGILYDKEKKSIGEIFITIIGVLGGVYVMISSLKKIVDGV